MKKFDVIRSVTDEQKFSELIFELIAFHDSPDDFAKFLSEDFVEDGSQTEESAAYSERPVSFESGP